MATFDLPGITGLDAGGTATLAQRGDAILKYAQADELEISWTPLIVNSADGAATIELLVTPDAVKLGGVRINVSATTQQQLADLYGALLFTPKVADLCYAARAVTIDPLPMPITSSTAAMVKESQRQDAAIQAAGGVEAGGIVGTHAKHWCIDNSLGLPKNAGKAENYGWMKPKGTPSPWQGVPIYPSVTLTALVIQQPSWAHDTSHTDYSQQCCLMHRSCKLNSSPADLSDVLADAKLGGLLSHNGPIPKQLQRQPGVPLYACAAAKTRAMRFEAQPVNSGAVLCPTPPPPDNIEGRTTSWPVVAATGAAAAGTVLAFWLALRYAGRYV